MEYVSYRPFPQKTRLFAQFEIRATNAFCPITPQWAFAGQAPKARNLLNMRERPQFAK